MLKLIHPIPAFTDNYIWTIIERSSNQAAVVDPGDAKPVLEYLQDHDLTLSTILITHHHPDHTGGLEQLIRHYNPVVYGPRNDTINGINHRLAEGDSLTLFDVDFTVLEVPGHTLDHIAFFAAAEEPPVLFCGDTLFAAGCGRLFEGTPEMMHQSLQKLTALPEQTRIYCTHEYTLANLRFAKAVDPDNEALSKRIQHESRKRDQKQPTLPSSMELELQTNPFVRCRQPAVMAAAQQRLGAPPGSETEVFAAIRHWKDNF